MTVTAKPDDSYVLDWVKVDGVDVTDKLVDGVLTLTVAGDHVVTASAHYVERMYTVSGSFAYADGLYAPSFSRTRNSRDSAPIPPLVIMISLAGS